MTWALLLSLLVKSSLIAGAGLVCSRLLAQRPVDRVDILRGVTVMLLALPVVMAVLPSLSLALLPAAAPTPAPLPLPMWQGEVGPVAGVEVSGALPWPAPVVIVGLVWLIGVAALAGRLLLGLATLNRWTRDGRAVQCPTWLQALTAQSRGDTPRLLASDRLSGPLSWGTAPGVILVDPASLTERQAAPAILAHELAHLRRGDWVFLVLSRLSLALFWFNPLVWRLHAELVARSEEAADAAALTTVDRAQYAKALVRLAASSPAHAVPGAASPMAADLKTLKTRIACIMSTAPSRRRPLTVALTVAALAAVATPLAALEISRQGWDVPPPPPAPPAAPQAPVPPAPPEAPAPLDLADLQVPPAPPAPPAPPLPPAPPAPPAPTGSYSYTYFRSGTVEDEQAAAEARARAAEARAQAVEARRMAETARAHAEQMRVHAAQMRLDGQRARQDGERARQMGEQARLAGERAREQGIQARAQARVHMRTGAEQMHKGADQMRAEAVRLQDPAYRAKQIAENRERGNTVTDAELIELSHTLPARAAELDRNADRMAERANDPA